jgi:hypothetical protein
MSVNLIFDVMKGVASLLNQDQVLGLVKKCCCPNFTISVLQWKCVWCVGTQAEFDGVKSLNLE